MAKLLNRLLITGAAGSLGARARADLVGLADVIRVSDIADLGEAQPHEEVVTCDLTDEAAMRDLVDGCDGIVHFGGASFEKPFEEIIGPNIRGMYNLYEAARATGCGRIIFASSNHTIGFHPTDHRIDADAVPIADGLYGASKVWGEQIGLLYWHKFGIETARVRIGSCFPEPRDRRMLSTWMSYRDFWALIERCFTVPRLGCPVIYGASNNTSSWWDNSKVDWLGWQPQDSADTWRAEFEPGPRNGDDPAVRFQGGGFAEMPIYRDD